MQRIQSKRVSVIVPVYNAEDHLHRSVESILRQTYTNIELILINDGSTDNSGKLCDIYAQEDPRVKVIHQANAGPSVARNVGLQAAAGAYIQFVDSDDSLEFEMTEKLVHAMTESVQLVICGYRDVLQRGSEITCLKTARPKRTGTFPKSELLSWFGQLFIDYFIHYNWNKLYDAALIRTAGISFDPAMIRGEDLLFNLKYLHRCENISIIADVLYNYGHSNSQSITSTFRLNLFENQQILIGEVRSFLRENRAYSGQNREWIEDFYMKRVEDCFLNLFHSNSTLSVQTIKKHIEQIIFDEQVNASIRYLTQSHFEKKLLGNLIRKRAVDALYAYYYGKSLLKQKR